MVTTVFAGASRPSRELLARSIDQRETAVHRGAAADVEAEAEVAAEEQGPVHRDLDAGREERGGGAAVFAAGEELGAQRRRVTEVKTVADVRHQEAVVRRRDTERRRRRRLDADADGPAREGRRQGGGEVAEADG